VKWLPLAEFAVNNGTSETTKCTPFCAVQGTDPRMSFVGEPTKDLYQRRVSVDQVQAMMQQIHEHLRVEMRWSQAVQEEGANHGRIPAPNIQEGSQVWLDARHIRTTRPTRKLDWKLLGPFMVVRRISPYAYELELPVLIRIHRVQPVPLLDLVADNSLDGERVKLLRSVEVDGEEEYQVSSVEDSRMYQNQLEYLLCWTGYNSLTWEPAKFVDGFQAVGEFHKRYPGKPGPLEDVLRGPRTYEGDTVMVRVESDGFKDTYD